jgi:hypothetical protein
MEAEGGRLHYLKTFLKSIDTLKEAEEKEEE